MQVAGQREAPRNTLQPPETEKKDFLNYSGISLRQTNHKADPLYKAEKDFAQILQFSGQTLLKAISIKRTIP